MSDLHPRHLCDFPAEPCRCAQILATVEGEPAPVNHHEAVLRELRAWLVQHNQLALDAAHANVELDRSRFLLQCAVFEDVIAKLDALEAK